MAANGHTPTCTCTSPRPGGRRTRLAMSPPASWAAACSSTPCRPSTPRHSSELCDHRAETPDRRLRPRPPPEQVPAVDEVHRRDRLELGPLALGERIGLG